MTLHHNLTIVANVILMSVFHAMNIHKVNRKIKGKHFLFFNNSVLMHTIWFLKCHIQDGLVMYAKDPFLINPGLIDVIFVTGINVSDVDLRQLPHLYQFYLLNHLRHFVNVLVGGVSQLLYLKVFNKIVSK